MGVSALVAVLVDGVVNRLRRDKGGGTEDKVSDLGEVILSVASALALTVLEPVKVLSTPAADGKGHVLNVVRHAVEVAAVTGGEHDFSVDSLCHSNCVAAELTS